MENITEIIGTLGFPIAITLILLYYINSELRKTRTVIEQNTSIINDLQTYIKTIIDYFIRSE